jgi:hypothetical protein
MPRHLVPPERFSRFRRVTPPRTLWAYFIPLPRTGFALQGLSSLPSRRASSTRRALLSFHRKDPTAEQARRFQFLPLRLQGLNPGSDPLRPVGGLDLPVARSPLGFSLLRACLRAPWERHHVPSTHDLLSIGAHCAPAGWPSAFQLVSDLMIYP